MMIRNLTQLDLSDKTVFLRVDFNVPIDQGKITEPHRIDSALPTIREILQRAKKLLIASHLGRPDGRVSFHAGADRKTESARHPFCARNVTRRAGNIQTN